MIQFGVPSFKTYLDGRTVMSSSKVILDLENPPALSVSLEPSQNMRLIENCINRSDQSYEKTVQCIDKEFDIKQIIEASPDIPLGSDQKPQII